MTIIHVGFSFAGLAEEPKYQEWERTPQYTSAFGVAGQSAIDSNRMSRDFTVRLMMYGGFATSASLFAAVVAAEKKIGQVGTWIDNGLLTRTILNVEFLSLAIEEGPLPTAPDGGWLAIVSLKFKQLSP
jgi:hypothetical protein